MLTLLMYAVCLGVAIQGARALQFAIAVCEPTKRWRVWVLSMGICLFVVATVAAILLAYQWTLQAAAVGRALEPFMH
jgi:hypothetical protein